jgi:hypothetical protein
VIRKYIVDIDGTILTATNGDYKKAKPIQDRIDKLNSLYDEGHMIIYWTARGANTGLNWRLFTKNQLEVFGVKYTELRMQKEHYDYWIDDKAFNSEEFFK